MKWFPVVLTFVFALACSGCSSDTETSEEMDNSTGTEKLHPAAAVANQVLAAIHNSDVEAIKSHFNETNRANIGDKQFAELIEGAREMIGITRKISELREGSLPNVVLAKVRAVGEEVHVLVLELEGGTYRLEDINSPTVVDFENMKLIE